ncbi:MAG: DoxX family protein [Verrucomicrobiae bacterium]|nr:DoxX family protein [Verrucomicrobiae bacterium]
MAFLQPESTPEPENLQARIGLADFYLLILRLLLAVPMFYYETRQHIGRAWGFLWEQKDWPLVDAFVAMELPQPSVTATTLIFLLLVCPSAIAIGFLTRVNAGLTFLAVLFFFLSGLPLSEWLNAQTSVLFLGICAVLVLSGPGRFSFDGAFAALRRRRKRLRDAAAL